MISLAVAIVANEADSAPFQSTRFPQIKDIAQCHPKTALGKLKAVITPTNPNGLYYSIIKWPGLSLGITLPPIYLDIPHAISHSSINSRTSSIPSSIYFPISKAIIDPSSS
jgi:hypothetical protein